jgi:hypothetical protein
MIRPMHRAGRIVLIEDITASDRERLPDWRIEDQDGEGCAAWATIVLVLAIAAGLAAWAFGA